MALSANANRAYEFNEDPVYGDLPVLLAAVLFEGSAVGDNGSGFMRPLVAADVFRGFAARAVTGGAASGDEDVLVIQRGTTCAQVVGVASVDDVGETVYMSDDGTFTLTSAGNSAIGKVLRYIGAAAATECAVAFEAEQLRSL